MPENILFLNISNRVLVPWETLVRPLAEIGYRPSVISADKEAAELCRASKWQFKRRPMLLTLARPLQHKYTFGLFMPVAFFLALIFLIVLKYRRQTGLVCFFEPELCLLLEPLTGLLGMKAVHIRLPGEPDWEFSWWQKIFLNLFRKKRQAIAFNRKTADKLSKCGYFEKNITLIVPGIPAKNSRQQESIFHDLACANNEWRTKKFFTVGAYAGSASSQNLELIFGAIKKSLNVVPNIQLIVIGEGAERKKLLWLAKKMQIENLIWFVGRSGGLSKWLNSLHIFLPASPDPTLADLSVLLLAMQAGVPPIVPSGRGYDDIIAEAENGIVLEQENSDAYAAAIIRLQQNTNLANIIKANAKRSADQKFSSAKMAEEFKRIFS